MKTSRKVHICLGHIAFLYHLENAPLCKAMLIRYQLLIITFMLCCC